MLLCVGEGGEKLRGACGCDGAGPVLPVGPGETGEVEGAAWEGEECDAARCPEWLGSDPTWDEPVREAMGLSGLGGGSGLVGLGDATGAGLKVGGGVGAAGGGVGAEERDSEDRLGASLGASREGFCSVSLGSLAVFGERALLGFSADSDSPDLLVFRPLAAG